MPGSASTRPANELALISTLLPRHIFLLAFIHRVTLVPEHCSSMPRTSALGICDIIYVCPLAVCTQVWSKKTLSVELLNNSRCFPNLSVNAVTNYENCPVRHAVRCARIDRSSDTLYFCIRYRQRHGFHSQTLTCKGQI
jgi:hypothetical protein